MDTHRKLKAVIEYRVLEREIAAIIHRKIVDVYRKFVLYVSTVMTWRSRFNSISRENEETDFSDRRSDRQLRGAIKLKANALITEKNHYYKTP